ncbi:cytidine deaminase [Mesomycoplasma bovoculi]|uniref:Cytidine deaminase n=1 Tax=Mesomycoplasma bovoculi M165/69 TaxID=743966 RepID=W5UTK7_9BACT|nr:cytidine deaminase [Mesomycoplasma bovoculi]AHH45452.1 cytidine deaminase [Mesomycoplasma bovoculi M165/69]
MKYLEMLTNLQKNAYAPYSNFPVSSIIIDKENNIWKGINVENAAYPSGICAERVAIFSAVASGKKPGDFKEVHILSNSDFFIVPCGGCLQVLCEFLDSNTPIFMYKKTGEMDKKILKNLLPFGFSKDFF